MAIEPYSDAWEQATYEQLAPQVQAMVQRIYGNSRGARFGASGALMAKRLAALKTEIALQASKAKADIQERIRQEGVASAEKEKDRQSILSRESLARSNKLQDDALARSQKWQDEQTGIDRRSDAVKEIRRNEIYKALGEGKAWPEADMRANGVPDEVIQQFHQKGQIAPPGSPIPTTADSTGSLRGGTAFTPRGDDQFLSPGDFSSSRGFKTLGSEEPSLDVGSPKSPFINDLTPNIGLGGPADVSPAFDASGQDFKGAFIPPPAGSWEDVQARPEQIGTGVDPSSVKERVWTPRGSDKHLTKPGGSEYETSPWNTDVGPELSGRGNTLNTDPGKPGSSVVATSFPLPDSGSSPWDEEDRNKYLRQPGHGTSADEIDPSTGKPYLSGTNYTDAYNRDLYSNKITKRGFSDALTNTGRTFADFWKSVI